MMKSSPNSPFCTILRAFCTARAGKHVLVEKPLALTYEDALQMIESCKNAHVIMGTNPHLRNAITHRKLHDLVADGAIGRPLAARVFHDDLINAGATWVDEAACRDGNQVWGRVVADIPAFAGS